MTDADLYRVAAVARGESALRWWLCASACAVMGQVAVAAGEGATVRGTVDPAAVAALVQGLEELVHDPEAMMWEGGQLLLVTVASVLGCTPGRPATADGVRLWAARCGLWPLVHVELERNLDQLRTYMGEDSPCT